MDLVKFPGLSHGLDRRTRYFWYEGCRAASSPLRVLCDSAADPSQHDVGLSVDSSSLCISFAYCSYDVVRAFHPLPYLHAHGFASLPLRVGGLEILRCRMCAFMYSTEIAAVVAKEEACHEKDDWSVPRDVHRE